MGVQVKLEIKSNIIQSPTRRWGMTDTVEIDRETENQVLNAIIWEVESAHGLEFGLDYKIEDFEKDPDTDIYTAFIREIGEDND